LARSTDLRSKTPAFGRGRQQASGLAAAQAEAARLPPLAIEALRIADTVSAGTHGCRRAGPGGDFWQFRPYMAGEMTQAIDWRVSARSDQLFVRERERSAAASLYLWRDDSQSMRWRGARGRCTKLERAELLLLALAALALRGEEQVALLGRDGRGRQGRAALTHLAAGLARPSGGSLPPEGPLPRAADLVLFGDFYLPLDRLARRLVPLAARSARGLLVQIFDPAEATLPYEGRVRFEGLEREGSWLAPRVSSLRKAYLERFCNHREALAALAHSLGWHFLALSSGRPAAACLSSLYAGLAPGREGKA